MDIIKNPWLILSVLLIYFSPNCQLSFGAGTISANQSLSGDQTIVSSSGDFVLGFFKPGNSSNSSNNYIGMWYGKVSDHTPVWVANRETPIRDRYSSELKISNGNLVLFNESKVPIWSTNISSTSSSSVVAVLEDGGNLVLRDGPNSSTPLWQSLEHPTHTWLPGGKLSVNKRTNQSQLLTSWRNSEDPAPGLYSLELDSSGINQYLILWNRSEKYWTSGPWDEQTRIFSLVPEMRLNYIYNFSFVTNENESYFTYSLYNPAIISRFIMDVSGQIKQLSWLESSKQWNLFWSQPRQQCEVYAFCGAFGSCNEKALPFCNCLRGFQPKSQDDWNLSDYSGGCERKTKLQCEDPSLANRKSDKFLESPNMVLPQDAQSMTGGSISECESTCLQNCSCTAYAYDSDGCKIWIGELLDLQQLEEDASSGKTIYIRLAASEFSSSRNNKGIIIGAVAGSAGLVLGLVMFAILKWKRRTMKIPKAVEGSLVAFGYRDLQSATKNFSEKLGGGGFGSVFKGTLSDSSFIAVKQLESISQGEKQFRTEVSTIGTIQHVNLVRLRGFCSEGTRKLLVYDYMPNSSLDAHLFHDQSSKVLDWKTRYQVALGTARGLAYLHEKCRDCIIHCDIKPENILLDADFCPKVADFGLAKLIGRDFSRVLTTMRGTRGYLAPEWISGVAITAKADVYSYGMMLFEFVSGRRNSEQSEDGKVRFFPTWAATLITQDGDVLSLLDARLKGEAPVEELSRICKVACWCIQDDETHRPSMGQVVQILEGVLDVNLPPVPRSLQVFDGNQEHIIFFTESSSSQSSQTQSNISTASSQAKSGTSTMSS
ncbi:PREDICTED: G-type lectin S-receptor-like serine/threonine-protein kinase At2g19130 [Theobroma cacao]|uniref:Receptor-like serine/threonine-protein kinase n=1 Tax=Theobroma cacao TaxID=3641 RepID=A0AB32W0L8_THECC|nr:PREDICTED: G-type lectin S-receptor-like serine/threonine-protein kinase At2g19130 [Theobroma cacao]